MTEYDHKEVRCEAMADFDCEFKLVGEPRTCCVCIGHDCKEAREEIQRAADLKLAKERLTWIG